MSQTTSRNRPVTAAGASWLDKPMPQAVEAERSLLGGLLQEPEWLSRLSAELRAEDFYRPDHAALYRLLQAMAAARKGIDLVTVAAEIGAHGDRYGGLAYVSELPEHAPTTVNLEHYAHIIVERAQLRALIACAIETAEGAFDGGDSVALARRALDKFSSLRERARKERHAMSVADLHRDQLDYWLDRDAGCLPPPLSTGFAQLDQILDGGMRPGQLVVIAGLTGMGKTALAISLACRWAGFGRSVLYHSGEMPKKWDLLERIQAAATGVSTGTLRAGELREEELEAVTAASEQLDRLVLHDRAHATVDHIAREARRLWVGGLAAVIVDYLGLLNHERQKGETGAQAVGRSTKALKQLGLELGCPVVVLAQFNRSAAKKDAPKGKKAEHWWDTIPMPSMHDLRDSGEIAEDADIILFPITAVGAGVEGFHRQAVIKVEKNRMGATGIARCSWDAESAAYVEGA